LGARFSAPVQAVTVPHPTSCTRNSTGSLYRG